MNKDRSSIVYDKTKKSHKDTARETSEMLARPVAPLALGAELRLLGEAHSKVSGKQNWLMKHSIDMTLFLGLIWGIGKIVYFYYPDTSWTIWVKAVDSFLPAIVIILAIMYRLYPLIDVFYSRKKKDNA